jgi:hypothetical protein
MRADGWSIGFGLAGIAAIIGIYACVRYSQVPMANEPEVLLYGMIGLSPYALATYGCGVAPKRSWSRRVAIAGGVGVCLVGAYWLRMAANDAIQVRAMREAGQGHGMPASAFMVLVLLPIQGVAGAVAAIVGGLAHDARRT